MEHGSRVVAGVRRIGRRWLKRRRPMQYGQCAGRGGLSAAALLISAALTLAPGIGIAAQTVTRALDTMPASVAPVLILAAAAPTRQKADPEMARRMQACTLCHGRQGRATATGYFPRIAGKPAGYLYNQLVNFRDGRRSNVAMGHLVQHLSDEYLDEIARYFSRLELPYPSPAPAWVDAALLARGEQLARRGDLSRQLPACASCHGDALTGVLPALPGLLGLPRDYIAAQLGAWKSGQRRAVEPDCMRTIAKRLDGEDVGLIAAWLAAQPVPRGGRAAPQPPAELPLRCGSGGH